MLGLSENTSIMVIMGRSVSVNAQVMCYHKLKDKYYGTNIHTVVPTKGDSDLILCLQLLSETLTCILHFSIRESIDHL